MNAQNFNGPDDDVAIFAILGVVLVILAVALLIQVLFLLNIYRCMQEVAPRNREIGGGVWLNLIPLFNIVWMFFTVNRVASSLEAEYRDRGWSSRGDDFARQIGMGWCICSIASNVPFVGPFVAIGGLVCFIMYWVRIAGYKTRLRSDAGGAEYDDDRRRDYDRYDDEDDRRDDRYDDDRRDRRDDRYDDEYDRRRD